MELYRSTVFREDTVLTVTIKDPYIETKAKASIRRGCN